MPRPRTVPADHPPFVPLPVTHVTLEAGLRAAVHVAGTLSSRRLPVVCIPGYQRNMSDFTEFAGYFRRMGRGEWPVVLLDLPGRGRSSRPGGPSRSYGRSHFRITSSPTPKISAICSTV